MTEPVMAGGHRRIDRVMDPMFLDGLGDARIEELRRRRDECRAEIEYLSYLRRLLQGRLDILRAERGQRESGAAGSLVDRLPEILSGGGATGSRGAFVHVVLPDEEMALARRHVERLVSDAGLSDLPALSDAALDEAVTALEEEEHAVSAARAGVFRVHDTLQGELKERYRRDPSLVLEG